MMKKNYRKIDLAKKLNKEKGFPILYSKKIIDDLIEISTEILYDDKLTLKNLGTFNKKDKRSRLGRNPRTKESHIIKARKVISFNPSKKLVNSLNE